MITAVAALAFTEAEGPLRDGDFVETLPIAAAFIGDQPAVDALTRALTRAVVEEFDIADPEAVVVRVFTPDQLADVLARHSEPRFPGLTPALPPNLGAVVAVWRRP